MRKNLKFTDLPAFSVSGLRKWNKNSLNYAFRELGRVARTQYFLEYITYIKLRETIEAATCKNEALQ